MASSVLEIVWLLEDPGIHESTGMLIVAEPLILSVNGSKPGLLDELLQLNERFNEGARLCRIFCVRKRPSLSIS
jgi:hypothetical protein